ncbi:MAG: ABC transporter permease, partial [bacterium]
MIQQSKMIQSLNYILTIAGAERVMLYRTAKFWVLGGIGALMVVFFMVVMTVVTIVEGNFPGEFLLEGTDGFLALYFFSYVQAILIIFVAGDFRKAEEKARLDQVMLSRPMTTANLVVGKYFGVVGALLYLNLFLMALAAIGRVFKVIFTGAGFNILPFVKYFVIAGLPSILFMTALVFFLVSLLRSQALAIILPLGYVASILFYFHHKFQGLFDYGAFFAPMFYSDLVGFGDISTVLWQRLFFVFLAFSLLGFSVILYPRLQQSVFSQRLSQISAVIFLFAAAAVAYKIVGQHRDEQKTRQNDFTN